MDSPLEVSLSAEEAEMLYEEMYSSEGALETQQFVMGSHGSGANVFSAREALYLGIAHSWNFNFYRAHFFFSLYSEKDIRHQVHDLELLVFRVLITGKKSLIDVCIKEIQKLEATLVR